MRNSTDKFIELMRQRYGPEEKVGRGNILNFGNQVIFAIGNSKMLGKGGFFFSIQSDFLDGKFVKQANPPLGAFAALICGDEQTVLIIPQRIIAAPMLRCPTDRFNIDFKDGKYFFRATGTPKFEVTEYLNLYPESEKRNEIAEPGKETVETVEQQQAEITEHTRIQWMLIRFGIAAGYSVRVPANDRNKEFNSEKFTGITIADLPNFGFDATTRQIISNIDVLWLEGNVIHKAFEIEATTSVYSGLLRMSDLVLAQPNVTIDLNIVAPTKRRELVRKNILRPTFARLRPKCSYITFEEVTTKYALVKDILRKQQAQIRDFLESEKF